jgi:pimeloyl-ACP methyl ester carboxylesterase
MKRMGAFRSPEAAARYHLAYHALLGQCPVPDRQFDVETSFGITRVYRWGQGDAPPIVLLSGMAATAGSWAGHIPALSQGHPVYAIDTLGEPSLSVQTAPLRDQDDRARWLDEVLAGLGLTGVHLVGGSMGGYYAVNQAIRAPGRLITVTCLDPVMVTSAYRVRVMLGILLVLLVRSKWLWRRTLRWWTGNAAIDPLELEIAMAGIAAYRAKLPPVLRFSEEQIRSIGRPVLAIFAGRSVLHDAALAADRARTWLRDGEVELWDMGHSIEDPDRFSRRVLDFVQQHTGAVR